MGDYIEGEVRQTEDLIQGETGCLRVPGEVVFAGRLSNDVEGESETVFC